MVPHLGRLDIAVSFSHVDQLKQACNGMSRLYSVKEEGQRKQSNAKRQAKMTLSRQENLKHM